MTPWNIYLVFIQFPWHTAPEILGISKVILYTNELIEVWKPLGSFWMGAGHKKDQSGLEGGDF